MPRKYFLTFTVDVTFFVFHRPVAWFYFFELVILLKNEHKSNPLSVHRPAEIEGPAEHVFSVFSDQGFKYVNLYDKTAVVLFVKSYMPCTKYLAPKIKRLLKYVPLKKKNENLKFFHFQTD